MFQAGGIQLISDLRWSDREYSHHSCDSKWHGQSLSPSDAIHISFTSPLRSCHQPIVPLFLLIPLPPLFHFNHLPPSFPDFPSVVPGQSAKQGCSFYTFPLLYASIFSPLHHQTTLPFHYLYSSHFLYSFSLLFVFFALSSPYTIRSVSPAMFP